MCQSSSHTQLLQPYGLEPSRFLCPWDFPGKNTRVGSHFLFQEIFLTQGLNLGLRPCRRILCHLSWSQGPHSQKKELQVRNACAKSLTLCDPIDYNQSDFSVHGILQARILEWVAIFSCRASSQPRDWTHVSCVSCTAGGFFTHWTIGEAPTNKEWGKVKNNLEVAWTGIRSIHMRRKERKKEDHKERQKKR